MALQTCVQLHLCWLFIVAVGNMALARNLAHHNSCLLVFSDGNPLSCEESCVQLAQSSIFPQSMDDSGRVSISVRLRSPSSDQLDRLHSRKCIHFLVEFLQFGVCLRSLCN